jgi:cytoskeletal protein RodZ
MNFFKWSIYLLALSAFIWFVFFKPLSHTEPAKIQLDSETVVSEEEDTEYLPESTIEDTETAETDVTASDTLPEEFETEKITVHPPKTNSSVNINSKYLIVVGSFGVKSNANRMLKRVKDSGKEGTITLIRGLHRVVTASTDDQNDAQQLRDHFTHIYKEQAFILEQ